MMRGTIRVVLTLRSTISTPEGKRRYVRQLFATIADDYDFITRFLSYGQDRRWKRRLLDLAAPGPADRVLDLACGTGDLLFAAAARARAAVGLDITYRMLQLARSRRRSGLGTRPRRRRHARAAVSRRTFRGRDDRIRTAKRGRPAGGTRRDPPRACTWRSVPVARFQQADKSDGPSALPCVSHRRSAQRSGSSCTGTRIPTATFPSRFVYIPEPPVSVG